MHAVGLGRERDIDAVVDQQARAVVPAQLAQLAGEIEQLCHGQIFLSELYRIDAALQRRLDDVEQRAPACALAVGDEVERREAVSARDSASRAEPRTSVTLPYPSSPSIGLDAVA